jgi:release factor glutamine methyltransferase
MRIDWKVRASYPTASSHDSAMDRDVSSPLRGSGPIAQSTVSELVRTAADRLGRAGIPNPRLDAEVLLRHVTGWSRTELFLRYPDPPPAATIAALEDLVARRLAGEPVAYLTGEREFMGLTFAVGPGVLVPRPETELLVEWALERFGDSPVADVGTGSGAIAVSVAALAKAPVTVIATDVSADALAIATGNADTLLTGERRTRLAFREGSLLEPVTERVSLVLANLPYLTPRQIAENPDLDAEPRLALDGGDDGLDLVRVLVDDLPRVLAPGGGVGLELDPSQCAAVEGLLAAAFPGRVVRTIRDLAGLERHVVMEPFRENSR